MTTKKSKPSPPPETEGARDKFNLRFPSGSRMRQRLAKSAKHEIRSINGEILVRLQKSLDRPTWLQQWAPAMVVDEIERRAEASGVEFKDMLNAVLAAGLREGAPQVLYISIAPGSTAKEIRAALDVAKDAAPADAPIFIDNRLPDTPPKE